MKNGKYCILIADDEKEIRDILRLLLEGEGYAVLTAEDGREAIAEAAAEVDLYSGCEYAGGIGIPCGGGNSQAL